MLLGSFDGELAMLLGRDAQRELTRIGATGQRVGASSPLSAMSSRTVPTTATMAQEILGSFLAQTAVASRLR